MFAEPHKLVGQKGLEFGALSNHGSDTRPRRPVREWLRQGTVTLPPRSAAPFAPSETFQVLRDLVVSGDPLSLSCKMPRTTEPHFGCDSRVIE